MDKIENFLNAFNDALDDNTLKALDKVSDILVEASNLMEEILIEDGATHTEIAMAKHFVELYNGIFYDILDEEFDVVRCDCDCEECKLES